MKLILTDLDNTLLDENGEINKETLGALSAARNAGILIAYATARPVRATYRMRKLFEPDYILANNGATITRGEDVVWNNCIDSDVLNAFHADVFSEKAITSVSIEVGDMVVQNTADTNWGKRDGWNPVYIPFDEMVLKNVPKYSTECKDSHAIIRIVEKYPSLRLYMNAGDNWQQIIRADSSKLIAAKRLSSMLGLTLSDIVAFGDDYNDMELIKECGKGVAVANAIPEVLRAADEICPANTESGVAKWLLAQDFLNQAKTTQTV